MPIWQSFQTVKHSSEPGDLLLLQGGDCRVFRAQPLSHDDGFGRCRLVDRKGDWQNGSNVGLLAKCFKRSFRAPRFEPNVLALSEVASKTPAQVISNIEVSNHLESFTAQGTVYCTDALFEIQRDDEASSVAIHRAPHSRFLMQEAWLAGLPDCRQ
jgi:hypothetical protein